MLCRNLILLVVLFLAPAAWADSLSDWILLEQTKINRTVDSTRIMEPDIKNQAKAYRPESQRWFPLKTVWVPADELNVAIERDVFDPELAKLFVRTENGKTEYRLLIHPESEKFYEKFLKKYPVDKSTFRATSTASSRTVLVKTKGKNGPRFFAKLSLDVELGGVRRTIPQGEVARSVGTSLYLRDLEKRIGEERFSHLPETFGISPKGWERGGMILRQVPSEILKNEKKLVPLFSLYAVGKDRKSLLQKLAAQSKLTPQEFVRRHILSPFYDGWVDWNLRGAVTMEAHAQNVLMELDKKGRPSGRFVHRDLGGFNIDLESSSSAKKLALPTFTNVEKDYHQANVIDARRQSLHTYFDGGFLYNVDKELMRIQPGYSEGSVFTDGNKILSSVLSRRSGVKRIPPATLSSAQGVVAALEKAESAYKKRGAKLADSCEKSFGFIQFEKERSRASAARGR
jgi:hypothetical protein